MRRLSDLVLVLASIVCFACSSSGDGTGTPEECQAAACAAQCQQEGKVGGSCEGGACVCQSVTDVQETAGDTVVPTDAGDTKPGGDVVDEDTKPTDVAGDSAGEVVPDGQVEDAGHPCTLATVATDCGAGQGCVEGECGPCAGAAECAVGLGCNQGVCGACAQAEACREGEGCKSGLCGPCTKAEQCRAGQACVTGICGPCSVASECFGELCTQGVCLPCYGAAACQEQYGEPYDCEQEKCVRTTCAADADCMLDGRLCSQVSYLCQDCDSNQQCLESAAYGAGYLCLGGRCEQGNCEDDQDCQVDAPICSTDFECRGCQANAAGPHGECVAKYGAGWMCSGSGACVQGNCLTSVECGAVNQGLCPTTEEVGIEIGGVVVSAFTCRPCVEHDEDARCRSEYGLDNLVCKGGKCVEGCVSGTACGFKQVCGPDKWCGGCGDNEQCSAAYGGAYSCVEGYCQPVQCDFDKPCGPGLICDNYVCRNCLEHSECPEGQVCDLGGTDTCKVGQCTKATEHELCWSHLCKANQCVGCSAANPCADGRFCGLDGVCYVGDCALDEDCPGDAKLCYEWKCLQGVADQRKCTEVVTPDVDCDVLNKCSKSRCQITGNCLPYEYKCDDGKDCTDDLCNPTTGVCSNPVRPFRCLIGDTCYYAGDAMTDEVTTFTCDSILCTQVCTELGFTVATCGAGQECTCALAPEVTPSKCTSAKCEYITYPWTSGWCLNDFKCEIDLSWDGDYCWLSDCQASCSQFGYGWTAKCLGSVCQCNQTVPAVCQAATCNQTCAEAGFASGNCVTGYSCQCNPAADVDLRCKVCNPDAGQLAWFSDNSRCADESACSEDVCGDFGCYHFEDVANACSIDVLGVPTCFANGAANPNNPCEYCDTSKTKTAWSKRTAGFKCGFCQECNSSGSCLGVSGKETAPSSCGPCQWCDGKDKCKPVTHGQDPKNDCGEPTTPIYYCGTNGNCDGNGACDNYGPDDSTGLVNDGIECTSPDYCQSGAVTGAFDNLKNCGNVSPMKFTPIYQNCKNGECVECSDLIGPGYNPCADGLLCCGGYCKPTCCDDGDCASGMTCGWKWIVAGNIWGCH